MQPDGVDVGFFDLVRHTARDGIHQRVCHGWRIHRHWHRHFCLQRSLCHGCRLHVQRNQHVQRFHPPPRRELWHGTNARRIECVCRKHRMHKLIVGVDYVPRLPGSAWSRVGAAGVCAARKVPGPCRQGLLLRDSGRDGIEPSLRAHGRQQLDPRARREVWSVVRGGLGAAALHLQHRGLCRQHKLLGRALGLGDRFVVQGWQWHWLGVAGGRHRRPRRQRLERDGRLLHLRGAGRCVPHPAVCPDLRRPRRDDARVQLRLRAAVADRHRHRVDGVRAGDLDIGFVVAVPVGARRRHADDLGQRHGQLQDAVEHGALQLLGAAAPRGVHTVQGGSARRAAAHGARAVPVGVQRRGPLHHHRQRPVPEPCRRERDPADVRDAAARQRPVECRGADWEPAGRPRHRRGEPLHHRRLRLRARHRVGRAHHHHGPALRRRPDLAVGDLGLGRAAALPTGGVGLRLLHLVHAPDGHPDVGAVCCRAPAHPRERAVHV
mmetsp:Transcript_37270/g.87678  ORF Transcript_37270/g.87678 Transcript_37270/m.87678 type:complete len:492 (+) Transcript_37270:3879-5354(+)